MELWLRIAEKLFLLYFGTYLLIDFCMFTYAAFVFRRIRTPSLPDSAFSGHSVSIIVPGYNEEVTIVHCLKQLLQLNYPDYNLIFINDGSKDSTLHTILQSFPLHEVPLDNFLSAKKGISTQTVEKVFTTEDRRLIVIDKANSGKADSINVGINYSTKNYICTIDADSILDSTSLRSVLVPMIKSPETFVAGGQLAAANDIALKEGKIHSGKMPRNVWVIWQLIEYIKSFMIAKISLSRIGALLIMSGAFSVYRRDDLIAVGGFLTKHNDHPYILKTIGCGHHTVCEDMEIVVRLWRYHHEQRKPARAAFIPNPVCWTEVPESVRSLFRQRTRWHLGLCETLKIHREMMFEPRYGTTGIIALPYYLFFEMFSPLVKLSGLMYLAIAIIVGRYNGFFMLLLMVGVLLLTTLFTSTITVFIERWSIHQAGSNRDALRYQGIGDWMILLGYSIAGDFFYGFFKTASQIIGMINFFQKKSAWNKFERKGFINNETGVSVSEKNDVPYSSTVGSSTYSSIGTIQKS